MVLGRGIEGASMALLLFPWVESACDSDCRFRWRFRMLICYFRNRFLIPNPNRIRKWIWRVLVGVFVSLRRRLGVVFPLKMPWLGCISYRIDTIRYMNQSESDVGFGGLFRNRNRKHISESDCGKRVRKLVDQGAGRPGGGTGTRPRGGPWPCGWSAETAGRGRAGWHGRWGRAGGRAPCAVGHVARRGGDMGRCPILKIPRGAGNQVLAGFGRGGW